MKIKYTSHSVERSLQRLGMTGVDFNRQILDSIEKGKIKTDKLFKQGLHHYWIKLNGKRIRLTLNTNILITIWKP